MKRSLTLCILISALFSVSLSFSQDHSISGSVGDADGLPIAFANVILMTAQDSTLVKGVSTNENGTFILANIKENDYVLKFSFIGFKDIYKPIQLNQSLNIGTVILNQSSQELNEVSILVKKPTLSKEADRLVFNIENTALVEGTIFEVLKNTPGILVMDNTIQVKNSNPTVYINDKKVQLNTTELIQLLEGSSANNIKSVEVITNPSARYDASSGAVINIVMSKNLISGYRGNVFANLTQGVFPRYNPGTSHFFKNDHVDFFANYSYSQDKINRDQDEVVNYLDNTNSIDEIFMSSTNRNTWSKTHNFNFNFDYTIDEYNTISVSSNMLLLPYFKYRIHNSTEVFDGNMNLDYLFNANNNSDDTKYNLGFDVDFIHKFKKAGEKLSTNAHFTTFNYDRHQNVKSDYYTTDGSLIETTAFRTDNQQETDIFTLKADYVLPMGESATLELGAKGSQIKSASNITQFDQINGVEIIDLNNTDAFDYDEVIVGGYVNFTKNWDKYKLVTGLRTEQTTVDSNSLSGTSTSGQNYLEWFPTASLSYNPSEKTSFYANYKRSIQRPNYQNLNPFQFYLNDFNIVMGNPNLKPILVDHAVIGTSLSEGTYTFEAYYKVQNNTIFELPFQDNVNNILINKPVNLDKTVEFGFDFITYFYVVENWSLYFVTSFYNTQDKAEFDAISIDRHQWSNYSTLSNDFTFLKDRSLNLNFNLTYLSKSLSGLRVIQDILVSELTVSKSILKDKGSISMVVSDLFNTQNFDISTRYLQQNSAVYFDQDTRFIKLGFRYKFGNTNLETNQRRKSQQETERLDNSGG